MIARTQANTGSRVATAPSPAPLRGFTALGSATRGEIAKLAVLALTRISHRLTGQLRFDRQVVRNAA
jgi:hypothetical protein